VVSQQLTVNRERFVVSGAVLALAVALVPGCYNTEPLPVTAAVVPEIDELGVITAPEVQVRGQWYVYGDAYGNPRSCMDVGQHDREQCSYVNYPPTQLPELNFPNQGGRMCLTGVVGRVLVCCTQDQVVSGDAGCAGVNVTNCFEEGELDHSSMWGAGMGFDLGLEPPADGYRGYEMIHGRVPWDGPDHQVIGISFDLDWHSSDEAPPLRVEFPMVIEEAVKLPETQGTVRLTEDGDLQHLAPGDTLPAGASSEEHPYGSPFWQEKGETAWKRSPIAQGTNTVLWDNVFAPPEVKDNYLTEEFTGEQLFGVQFHVIPDDKGETDIPFSFCISNLKFLTR